MLFHKFVFKWSDGQTSNVARHHNPNDVTLHRNICDVTTSQLKDVTHHRNICDVTSQSTAAISITFIIVVTPWAIHKVITACTRTFVRQFQLIKKPFKSLRLAKSYWKKMDFVVLCQMLFDELKRFWLIHVSSFCNHTYQYFGTEWVFFIKSNFDTSLLFQKFLAICKKYMTTATFLLDDLCMECDWSE